MSPRWPHTKQRYGAQKSQSDQTARSLPVWRHAIKHYSTEPATIALRQVRQARSEVYKLSVNKTGCVSWFYDFTITFAKLKNENSFFLKKNDAKMHLTVLHSCCIGLFGV